MFQLLDQNNKMKRQMLDKDHKTVLGCERLKKQERKICEYAVKYASDKINFDMTKAEIDYLRAPEQKGFVPLDQRVGRYLNEVNDGQWADPLEIGDRPDFLMRPFYFYGGYTALNAQDCFEFRESEKILHYKRLILDLKDANEQLNNDLKINNLKAAMLVIEKQTCTFIMSRARKFIHETTDFVVGIL